MIDVVIYADGPDNELYRRPNRVADILESNWRGTEIAVRSVVVIDKTTGLTSTYRSERIEMAVPADVHLHSVRIVHLGKLDHPDEDGNTESYGAQISACDESHCTVFDYIRSPTGRRELTVGLWKLTRTKDGSWDAERVSS